MKSTISKLRCATMVAVITRYHKVALTGPHSLITSAIRPFAAVMLGVRFSVREIVELGHLADV